MCLIPDLILRIITEQPKVLKREITILVSDVLRKAQSVDELIISLNHISNGL